MVSWARLCCLFPLLVACQPPPAQAPPPAPLPVALAAPAATPPPAAVAPEELLVDRAFAEFQGDGHPGCVIGVDKDGRRVLTKAYGLADLEHGARNSPDTIFEAGSVSKQFTAFAMVLLARQGKLSLDDDVRTYLPELPRLGRSITLRQLLGHTSGLRDWGELEDVAGWPRGTRTYTQALVLDLMRRQRALNFTPGTAWSYSNSNYNLAAIIVERVSGLSFPEFTRQNLFAPLGMTHTSWRDDFTRVVPGRANAYSEDKNKSWHRDTPIENAIGNAGLLTTVGDLLLWNENLSHPHVGDAALVATLEREGVLDGGRKTGYGLGLFLRTTKGIRSISHSGVTGGYRTYLERLPDQGLSIAILCNAATAKTGTLARETVKAFLPPTPEPAASAPALASASAGSAAPSVAGLYRSARTGAPVTVVSHGNGLKLESPMIDLEGADGTLHGVSATLFQSASGARVELLGARTPGGPDRLRLSFLDGNVVEAARVTPSNPDLGDLQALEGEYVSDEADARFDACVRDGKLVLFQGPVRAIPLSPSYEDVFVAHEADWLVSFRRTGGRVSGVDIGSGRMWRLPFVRTAAHPCAERH